MTIKQASPKQRFDELIVGYVNGALDADERQWVEQYLRAHADAQHELTWHQQLKRASQMQALEAPQDVGLARLLAQVRAEHTTQTRPQSQPQTMSLLQRIADFYGFAARPGYALAGLVVLAQAVALGVLFKQVSDRDRTLSEYSETRALPSSAVRAETARLQITFKSNATEQQIRLLLVGLQANIVSGPRQLGDYTIALPRGGLPEAKALLQRSPIVELVSANELDR